MDRKYLLTAFGYGIAGLALGIYMASSQNHGQLVTHAHIMLLGFVVSFIYATSYKLWLYAAAGPLVKVQYYTHQVGTAVLVVGLFLLYGRIVSEAVVGPIMGIASILVLTGMVLMKVLVLRSRAA